MLMFPLSEDITLLVLMLCVSFSQVECEHKKKKTCGCACAGRFQVYINTVMLIFTIISAVLLALMYVLTSIVKNQATKN